MMLKSVWKHLENALVLSTSMFLFESMKMEALGKDCIAVAQEETATTLCITVVGETCPIALKRKRADHDVKHKLGDKNKSELRNVHTHIHMHSHAAMKKLDENMKITSLASSKIPSNNANVQL